MAAPLSGFIMLRYFLKWCFRIVGPFLAQWLASRTLRRRLNNPSSEHSSKPLSSETMHDQET